MVLVPMVIDTGSTKARENKCEIRIYHVIEYLNFLVNNNISFKFVVNEIRKIVNEFQHMTKFNTSLVTSANCINISKSCWCPKIGVLISFLYIN